MRNYKDLHVWEKAHTLTLAVYKDTQQFPSEERFGLTSQIRRSRSSIPANLAGVVAGDGMERWLASSRWQWAQAPSSRSTACCRGI
jgi:hypothetical protein